MRETMGYNLPEGQCIYAHLNVSRMQKPFKVPQRLKSPVNIIAVNAGPISLQGDLESGNYAPFMDKFKA